MVSAPGLRLRSQGTQADTAVSPAARVGTRRAGARGRLRRARLSSPWSALRPQAQASSHKFEAYTAPRVFLDNRPIRVTLDLSRGHRTRPRPRGRLMRGAPPDCDGERYGLATKVAWQTTDTDVSLGAAPCGTLVAGRVSQSCIIAPAGGTLWGADARRCTGSARANRGSARALHGPCNARARSRRPVLHPA